MWKTIFGSERQPKKLPSWVKKFAGSIFGITVILFLIGLTEESHRRKQLQTAMDRFPAEISDVHKLREYVVLFTKSLWPEEMNSNDKDKKIMGVVAMKGDSGNFTLITHIRMGTVLSNHYAVAGILYDVKSFLEKAMSDPRFDNVESFNFQAYSILVDQYGRESEKAVAWIEIPQTVAKRVIWKRTTTDSFSELLQNEGKFKLHSALME